MRQIKIDVLLYLYFYSKLSCCPLSLFLLLLLPDAYSSVMLLCISKDTKIADKLNHFLFTLCLIKCNTMRTIYKYEPIDFQANVFPNQDDFGKKIAQTFLDRDILSVLAIAPTQSGKTGSMLAIIQHMLSNPILSMPLEHVFVITGHSSVEWLEQTKERFPEVLHSHIYHRNTIDSFVEDIKGIHSALVIIDENQIAMSEGQTIHKAFKDASLDTLDSLYRHDIKVVQFSATPLNVHVFNNPHSRICYMIPPSSYVSIQRLLLQNRVKQYKDLCGKHPKHHLVSWKVKSTFVTPSPDIANNISEILDFIYDEPKFHIIRTPPSYLHDVVISNFIQTLGNDFKYFSDIDIDDLGVFLSVPPRVHSFIFIKERLRCAKTIPKQHLGVLYERVSGLIQDNVIVQGLAGRLTGYHDNDTSVVFTNILSIRRYLIDFHSEFKNAKTNPRAFVFIY